MPEAAEFADLMGQLRAGAPEAARLLHQRYNHHLITAVRRRLHQRLRTVFESQDFAQDVWKSFFTDPSRRQFADADELIRFLSGVATRKVIDAWRAAAARKRGAAQTRPLDQEPPAPQATPSQDAAAGERWHQLIHELPDPYRRALELLRGGHTH